MKSGRLFLVLVILLVIPLLNCNRVSCPSDPPDRAQFLPETECRAEISNGNPILTVTNEYTDPIVSSTPVPFAVILEAPAGLPIEFCWTAEASESGYKVEAYRYGWDIVDLNDPELWSIDFTPLKKRGACAPPRTFFFGTHSFHVEVIDEAGNKSQALIKLNIAPYPMFFDLMPGSCPNSLNAKRRGTITAAVPASPGFDLHTIDLSSLELRIGGNMVLPERAFFEDITSPAIYQGDCDCYEGERDGTDDLVVKFSAQEVIGALGPVSRGDTIIVNLRASGEQGLPLDMRDCLTIVGNPHSEGENHDEGVDLSG